MSLDCRNRIGLAHEHPGRARLAIDAVGIDHPGINRSALDRRAFRRKVSAWEADGAGHTELLGPLGRHDHVVRIDGARGVLVNITASSEVTLEEFQEASTLIQEAVHPDAKIKCGLVMDDQMADDFRVTVIATGIGAEARMVNGGSRLAAVEPYSPARGGAGPDGRAGQQDRIYVSRFDGGAKTDLAREVDLDTPTFIRQQAD